jgi:hypothetical protein
MASRAVSLLASFPDAHRTACALLAALRNDVIDGSGARAVIASLVDLLWARDRAQTVELGRAALRGGRHDTVAHDVLCRVARAPREEDRPLLADALAAARERGRWLVTSAVSALVRLGASAAEWQAAVDAIMKGDHRDLDAYLAIAGASEETREALLAASVAKEYADDQLRLAALDALAHAGAGRHLAALERAIGTNHCCPCCTKVPERAAEVAAGVGTPEALATLIRALVAMPRGPDRVVGAVGEGIASLATRLARTPIG